LQVTETLLVSTSSSLSNYVSIAFTLSFNNCHFICQDCILLKNIRT